VDIHLGKMRNSTPALEPTKPGRSKTTHFRVGEGSLVSQDYSVQTLRRVVLSSQTATT